MALAARLDDPATRERFAAWLGDRVGANEVALGDLPGPAFSGYSNETVLFDASWEDAGGEPQTQGLAVRLEPAGHQVFPDTLFETQVRVMRALSGTGVPAPEVLWWEPDPSVLGSAFFVMRRLEGRVPPDNPPYHTGGWLQEASPEVRGRIWWNGLEAMAGVHGLDRAALDLPSLDRLDAAGRLAADRAYADWVLEGRAYPLIEEAFEKLAASVPGDLGDPALCWGDSRIGNVMYDGDGEVVAVLDWEMVSIGDPQNDLAWFLLLDRHHSEACDVPRLEGFPSHAETVARWEARTGRTAVALDWWMLLGAARYGAILTRVLDLLDDAGLFPGARETMSLDNTGTILLRKVMERPLMDGATGR